MKSYEEKLRLGLKELDEVRKEIDSILSFRITVAVQNILESFEEMQNEIEDKLDEVLRERDGN